jgi:hypothetical protein
MGGIISTPKSPPPPDDTQLKKQEARQQANEISSQREIQARRRARKVGGYKLLLSSDRENPELGVQNTLGPAAGA